MALREPSSRADRGHPELPAAPPGTGGHEGQLQREKREALEKLAAQEARFQETLNELAAARDAQSGAEAEAARLQQELTMRGAAAVDELNFDEKTTRRRLIDAMLIEAGWNLGPKGANTVEITQEERVEHQPTETGEGHVDYVLWDHDGKPLALVEARRTSIDAKDGQIQARHSAGGLERTYGRRPVILCTNGFEIWIWDDAQGYPPRAIFGFYSKDSLQQLVFQRSHAQPLASLSPDPGTVDRLYQTNAIKSVTERFAGKRRKALLVQATGHRQDSCGHRARRPHDARQLGQAGALSLRPARTPEAGPRRVPRPYPAHARDRPRQHVKGAPPPGLSCHVPCDDADLPQLRSRLLRSDRRRREPPLDLQRLR